MGPFAFESEIVALKRSDLTELDYYCYPDYRFFARTSLDQYVILLYSQLGIL